jgi:UDP-N-acetylglucosamine--N-acetylmuramyl-(pentapeptide) pyrophosphoryl-undecaprenol N-acetylglucosamine transferase
MAASSESLGIRDADRRMADLVLEVATSSQHSRNQHSTKQHGMNQHSRKR